MLVVASDDEHEMDRGVMQHFFRVRPDQLEPEPFLGVEGREAMSSGNATQMDASHALEGGQQGRAGESAGPDETDRDILAAR